MRANSFAILIGEGAADELMKRMTKVGRYHERLLVSTGNGFDEIGRASASSNVAIGVLSLGGEPELPVIQGLLVDGFGARAKEHHRGEFALLAESNGEFIAERDALGTRQLYVTEGRIRGVTSDFRLLNSGLGDLLQPGTLYSLTSGAVGRRTVVRERTEANFEEAASRLAVLIEESVRKRVEGHRRVAISFSGGLDSALLAFCASKFANVVLCSVFTKGSRDEMATKKAADLLGLEIASTKVDRETVTNELRSIELPFEPTIMDNVLWTVYSLAGRIARESGAEVLLLGQLADELFGGYMKYSIEKQRRGDEAARRLMDEDVFSSASRGFIRDEMACARWIEPRFPFADESIVEFALGLPVSYKLSDGERKRVLRSAALELGLTEELARSPKRAAQYSSGIMKTLR